MPSVFFSVKYKARAIAKERSARRIGNEIFGASVEALPKRPSKDLNEECRISRKLNAAGC